ncbi:RagB/SusD family nutrient uptake outer membrane protein [Halalkalibaculum sp. DA3122]|uniref:RagB/SusD family nutrient uptake outer membrane protein n=1 Tax=Halalkalibaculum sp. DA3122 TaxID=3373607 RepID=UPI00375448ED
MELSNKTNKVRYRILRVWPAAVMLCAVMFLWTGCDTDNYLSPDPASFTTTANYFEQPSHFEAALAAAYTDLRGVLGLGDGVNTNLLLKETRGYATNRMFDPNLPGIDAQNVMGWFVNPSNTIPEQIWGGFYETVNTANTVITRIDDIEWENSNQRDRILNEAKFIRAVSYFNLVQLWSDVDGTGVPLVTEETSSPAAALDKVRASESEVYAQIISDLEDATSLPSKGSTDLGRATAGAANFLLGKTRLLTGDYTGAISALESLAGEYSLLPQGEYIDIFNPDNNYNDESIFELEYSNSVAGQPDADFLDMVIPHHYADNGIMQDNFPGMPTTVDGSNEGIYPSYQVWDFFDTANDERYTDMFYWTADPSNATFGGVAHTPFSVSSDSIATIKKYYWPSQIASDGEQDGNLVIFRYADALLALAEAHWQRGDGGDDVAAIGYINDIRERAGMAPTSIATLDTDYPVPFILEGTFLDSDNLGRAIFMERTVELLAEGHSIMDLFRFSHYNDGTLSFAHDVLVTFHDDRIAKEGNVEGISNIDISSPAELVLPIPVGEIQNTQGQITQNSFYQ